MPLSGKSNISNADFVIFRKPQTIDTADRVAWKKLAFERRRSSSESTRSMSPTNPKSTGSGALRRAVTALPSAPESPRALHPAACSEATSCLLTSPA